MLTHSKPVKCRVGTSEVEDLYVPVGDPIGFRGMCPWSAEAIWGVQLELLESVRVWTDGGKEKP